jgi:hypothetical protein
MSKRCFFGGAMILTAALVVVPAPTTASEVAGKWSYEVSGGWKKGPCPAGKGGSGEIRMTQEGDQVTLVFLSGRACRPKSMCTFKGTLTGQTLVVKNAATVDGEGGQAKNEISLTFSGSNAASGTSESSYTHPGGMECRWGSKLTLKR